MISSVKFCVLRKLPLVGCGSVFVCQQRHFQTIGYII
nr:MAG TPA: hypothetical protein [Caudoviricetes sp.]